MTRGSDLVPVVEVASTAAVVEPAMVLPPSASESIELPEGTTGLVPKPPLVPLGSPVTASVTGSVNPSRLTILTATSWFSGTQAVISEGSIASVKSGCSRQFWQTSAKCCAVCTAG